MNVKVLHPSGEITEECLCLDTDILLGDHNDESELNTAIHELVGYDLCSSPIYCNEDNLLNNSMYIDDYTNERLEVNCNDFYDANGIEDFDILMTEEQYEYLDDIINSANVALTTFCYEFNHLFYAMQNKGLSDNELADKCYEYMKKYDPFNRDIEEWANRFYEMAESAKKEELELE